MQTAQSPGLDTHHSVIVARFLDLASLDVEPTSAAAAYDRAQQVLKSDPAFGPALMLTALVDYRNQRILQARKTAEHVLAQYRHFSPAHRLLALLYLADPPDNDRAYSHALKAREAYPSDSEVAMALGIACHRRNDHRRAIELLQEATAKQPNEAEALYYLGLSSLQVKDIAPARVALEKVVKLQPETPLAQQASQVLKGLD
jgi:tetratricopeptide (TPR) repeat protein